MSAVQFRPSMFEFTSSHELKNGVWLTFCDGKLLSRDDLALLNINTNDDGSFATATDHMIWLAHVERSRESWVDTFQQMILSGKRMGLK